MRTYSITGREHKIMEPETTTLALLAVELVGGIGALAARLGVSRSSVRAWCAGTPPHARNDARLRELVDKEIKPKDS